MTGTSFINRTSTLSASEGERRVFLSQWFSRPTGKVEVWSISTTIGKHRLENSRYGSQLQDWEEAAASVEEGKVKCRVKKERRKTKRVANGAFTTSRRLHMRLLSVLETFVRTAAAAALALVSFPYHVRHFCGAHTPTFYLHPSDQPSYPSASPRFPLFFPSYIASRRSRELPLVIFCLREPSCRSDHRHYSSRTHLRRKAERAHDDAAFLPVHTRIVPIKARRVVSHPRGTLEKPPRSSSWGTTSSTFITRHRRREPTPSSHLSLQIKVLRGSIFFKGNRQDPWSWIHAYISFPSPSPFFLLPNSLLNGCTYTNALRA